jgi:transcriptional regulator with PAS, ATPase and Fis domain
MFRADPANCIARHRRIPNRTGAIMRGNIDWTQQLPVAITVVDTNGIILAMNARSKETFAKDGGGALVGTSVYDCHPAAAQEHIARMMQTHEPNHYTIAKNGRRKIIHQIPWFKDGEFAGLVEISVPIPDSMPHFDRG